MSKSKGNVSDPFSLLRRYGSDVLRAYLCSRITLYQDGVFSEELFADFYRGFFVKKLSNLLARTARMLELYNQGVVPDFKSLVSQSTTNYFRGCSKLVVEYRKMMELYSVTAGFASIEALLDLTNKFISEVAPWKVSAEGNWHFLQEVLNMLVNAIKMLAFLLTPFTPGLAGRIMFKFGINHHAINFVNLLDLSNVNGQKIRQTPLYFFT